MEEYIALKEWAQVIKALDTGNQIILLRKGGINEAKNEFSIRSKEFFLYPTYEHQREGLLKKWLGEEMEKETETRKAHNEVEITNFAVVTHIHLLKDANKVACLSPYHILNDEYVLSRLAWKPRKPLALMLLRVFRLRNPLKLTVLPEYRGCTSWVELRGEGLTKARNSAEPVLSEDVYCRVVNSIENAIMF
ncbi:MAG: DUF1802 family protein [Candidatus Caldarchaeum sp.]